MKKHSKKLLIICLVCTFIFNLLIPIRKPQKTVFVTNENTINLHPKQNTDIRIMTYNILSDSMGFDGFSVETRKDLLYNVLLRTTPDILGLQEVCRNWYSTINEWEMPLRFVCPVGYLLSGTMTTLLYNPDKFELLHHGTKSFSFSFISRLRKYNWAVFEQKSTHKTFVVINTHLSLFEKTPFFPINQATELINFTLELQEKYKCPIFLIGDFNTKEDDNLQSYSTTYEYITLFLNNSKNIALSKSYSNEKTISNSANDYIFATDNTVITNYTLLSQPILNILSDHYPVFADVNLE